MYCRLLVAVLIAITTSSSPTCVPDLKMDQSIESQGSNKDQNAALLSEGEAYRTA